MNRRKYDFKKRKVKRLVSTVFTETGERQKISVSCISRQHIRIEVVPAKRQHDKAKSTRSQSPKKSEAPVLHVVK